MAPLIAPLLAASAGADLIGGIAGSFANNEAQKRNRAELERLQALESGGGLGLTPTEQRLLDNRLNAPVAAATTAGRQRNEQLMAAAGTTTGADVARMREEQARVQAGAAQEAALQVIAADQQKTQQQKNEIEQRIALKTSMKQDDIAGITGGISQAAGAGAQLAGSMPGTFQLSGVRGGSKGIASTLGVAAAGEFSKSELKQLLKFADENPEEAGRQFAALLRKSQLDSGTDTSTMAA